MIRICVLTLLLAVFCGTALAEDISKLTDEFYMRLAEIIEDNMDDAQGCVQEVKMFYDENQEVVVRIRKAAEEAMAQAGPMMAQMMQKYQSMSEEELEALERKQGMKEPAQPQMSEGMARYTKALETFTMKYPQQGMEIAMQAMQFMPGFEQGKPMFENQ